MPYLLGGLFPVKWTNPSLKPKRVQTLRGCRRPYGCACVKVLLGLKFNWRDNRRGGQPGCVNPDHARIT